jgi:hypothetical protein
MSFIEAGSSVRSLFCGATVLALRQLVLWQAHLPNGRAGVHSDEVGQGFEAKPAACTE